MLNDPKICLKLSSLQECYEFFKTSYRITIVGFLLIKKGIPSPLALIKLSMISAIRSSFFAIDLSHLEFASDGEML